jgi:hypothetical protein
MFRLFIKPSSSCNLKSILYIKAPLSYSLKMTLQKAETCRCYYLLIIFTYIYIIKVVLGNKIIYILLTAV